MSETKRPPRPLRPNAAAQSGAFIVEFALLATFFFTVLFGVIELARVIYLFNTLQEVTRRAAHAASGTSFEKGDPAIDLVRKNAIFQDGEGELFFGGPVTYRHIRIDYLALKRAADNSLTLVEIPTDNLPTCPARNVFNCTMDQNNTTGKASCIRFVRVRVCDPGKVNDCIAVNYAPLMPLIPSLSLTLPISTTIVKAETLGYTPGQAVCP